MQWEIKSMEFVKYIVSLGFIVFLFIIFFLEVQFYKLDFYFFKCIVDEVFFWRECMSKKILFEKVYVIIFFDLIVKLVLINEDYLCE